MIGINLWKNDELITLEGRDIIIERGTGWTNVYFEENLLNDLAEPNPSENSQITCRFCIYITSNMIKTVPVLGQNDVTPIKSNLLGSHQVQGTVFMHYFLGQFYLQIVISTRTLNSFE